MVSASGVCLLTPIMVAGGQLQASSGERVRNRTCLPNPWFVCTWPPPPCLQGLFIHGLLGVSLGLLMEQVWVGLDGKLLVLSGNHAWSRKAPSLKLHSFEDGAHSDPVTSGTFGVSRPELTGNL